MTEYALNFEHQFRYTNVEPLPVRDVVESLSALDSLSRRFLPRALNQLAGIEVAESQLLVLGFDEGSFIEHVVTRLIFGSQEQLDACIDKVREGRLLDAAHDVWKNLPPGGRVKALAITAALAGLVYLGATHAMQSPPTPAPAPVINNITIIETGAAAYRCTPEQFVARLHTAVGTDRTPLARDAVRILAPAKLDPQGTLEIGDARLEVARSLVEAIPTEYEPPPAELRNDYQNVIVKIRATDRDSTERGWSGIVDGLFKKRVKMELGEGVDATSLSRQLSVHADVTVISRPDAHGRFAPARIIVSRVLPTPRRSRR